MTAANVPEPPEERGGDDRDDDRIPPRASRDLRAEHVLVLRMLKILDALRPRLAEGDIPTAEDWGDIVTFLRVFVDRCHHGKEERVLFPAVMQVADEETRALIEELLVEHVEGRRVLTALASAAGTDPVVPGDPAGDRRFDPEAADEAIAAYVSLIRPHVIKEEKRLYPTADGLLAPELQETIEGEYDVIEREVTGAGVHEAFEQTVDRLLRRYVPRSRG